MRATGGSSVLGRSRTGPYIDGGGRRAMQDNRPPVHMFGGIPSFGLMGTMRRSGMIFYPAHISATTHCISMCSRSTWATWSIT